MNIFDAIVNRDIEQVRISLECDNGITQIEHDDITALHFAVSYGFSEAVSLLLKFGSDINKTNTDGLTPLDYALEFGDKNVIKVFKKFVTKELY